MKIKPLTQEQLDKLHTQLTRAEKRRTKVYWMERHSIGSAFILGDPLTTNKNKHLNLEERFEIFDNFWHAWAYRNKNWGKK